jgi:hypothetical protein
MKTKSSIGKTAASFVAGGALVASLYANAVYVPQQERALEADLQSELALLASGESELVSSGDGFTVTEAVKAAKVLAVEGNISKTVSSEGAVVTVASVEQEVGSAYTDAVVTVASAEPATDLLAKDKSETAEGKVGPNGEVLFTTSDGRAVWGSPRSAGFGGLAELASNPLTTLNNSGNLPSAQDLMGPVGSPLAVGPRGTAGGGGGAGVAAKAASSGAGGVGAAASSGGGGGGGAASLTAPREAGKP